MTADQLAWAMFASASSRVLLKRPRADMLRQAQALQLPTDATTEDVVAAASGRLADALLVEWRKRFCP